jgi:hypothetical protein
MGRVFLCDPTVRLSLFFSHDVTGIIARADRSGRQEPSIGSVSANRLKDADDRPDIV